MIILGNVGKGAGLADMQITAKLLGIIHLNDFMSPLHGATIALGLIYLKTNQKLVADKLAIPDNMHFLDRIPPDLILLRVLARHLVMFDFIEPSQEWVEGQLPSLLKSQIDGDAVGEKDVSLRQAYESIIAGACFSIGLRFAGSANRRAFDALVYYFDKLKAINNSGGF